MAPKKKVEKMTLGNFLVDQTYGSWAEEMDDMPLPSSNQSDSRSGYGSARRDFGSSRSGFSGERDYADRGFYQREQLPLPSKPPFTAHLGNLSFDVTQGDIEDFFTGCQVTNVRIVEDKQDRKPKGFGYVEFESLDGLKKALELSNSQLQGRNVRISVADPPKDRQDAREINDWTRKGPLPDLPQNQRRPSERGAYRSVDATSDTGSERGGSRRGPPPDGGDGKVRDFGNWERKGPLAPAQTPAGGQVGDGRTSVRRNDRSFERHASPSWGEGRSQDGSRPPRRDIAERPAPAERQPTAADMDNQWRARMRPDPPAKSATPTPDPSLPSSPVATTAVPATRPKLNLQKRTVSDASPADQAAASASDSKASPFGAARPIDTAARERQIEEKMLATRAKKEEEDRERKAKLDAEKAAEKAKSTDNPTSPVVTATSTSGTAGPAATTPQTSAPTAPRENGRSQGSMSRNRAADTSGKENGSSTPVVPGSNFEILRRMADQDNEEAEAETEDDGRNAPANGQVIDDKETKPQEVVRDPAAREQPPSETSTDNLEGDGWATVTKSTKRGRGGGGQSARAIAS